MHVIGCENYQEAAEAIRDILMLNVDLADSTEGSGHAANVHIRFDPLKFVDAQVESDGYHYVDVDLLHAGSAIAIVCIFYDLWVEEQSLAKHPASQRYQTALTEGRLSHLPDIEILLGEPIARNEMPPDDSWFDQVLAPLYRKYVLGFFGRLATADRFRS